jgi:hypothetical protein
MKDPTPFEKKMIAQALESHRVEQQFLHKLQFKHETNAITVIKDKLKERIAKNLYNGNDWKVRFYQHKLELKPRILDKLKGLIK